MSFRQLRVLGLSAIFIVSISALPLAALPRDAGGRDGQTPFERIVKRVKQFVAVALDELTMPKP